MSGRKALNPHLKKEPRRRSSIEPVIGHMKSEHRLGRNFLRHKAGDRFNVEMAAAGYNFARLIRWFADLLRKILRAILTAAFRHFSEKPAS
jgi:IS5 family transposase